MKKIVVIGNGKMAIDCIKILQEQQQAEVVLVVGDPENVSAKMLQAYCENNSIPLVESSKINSSSVLDRIRESGTNLIFNINSYKIIKKDLMNIPEYGVINFHNGPLPKYRGVNICSWCLINGEKEHGVAWHYVDDGVDTGNIIGVRLFKVEENATAISLIMKSINEGILLFKEIVPNIINDRVKPIVQDESKASYYSKKDIPFEGMVNYEWDFQRIDSFIRGLCFYPMKNDFVYPSSTFNGKKFFFSSIRKESSNEQKVKGGTIVKIDESRMYFSISDSIISVNQLFNSDLKKIKINEFVKEYGIVEGQILGK
ncbi:methionyl-tRNA formyltransferase [Clostridium sp. DJ247]|uniref:methionyl-tRNA formyltransferase n=1 Tax=Clostridium sp. DJ247 TaxID=2726188 RepID=UPI001625BDFC|nr:formyltransferase family protein [Clostridium sp. DJ247]MBC2580391.1 hypothetical protein [Clostridium sp. DJ247]